MTVKRMYLAALALLAVILLARLIMPYPLPDSNTITPPPSPALVAEPGDELLQSLLGSRLWMGEEGAGAAGSGVDGDDGKELTEAEAEAAAAEEAAAALVWRLEAVTVAGADSVAVVTSRAGTERLQVGDSLPDGGRVTGIAATGITIERSGKEERVHLFGKQ